MPIEMWIVSDQGILQTETPLPAKQGWHQLAGLCLGLRGEGLAVELGNLRISLVRAAAIHAPGSVGNNPIKTKGSRKNKFRYSVAPGPR
jgi:hypothetical protein